MYLLKKLYIIEFFFYLRSTHHMVLLSKAISSKIYNRKIFIWGLRL